MAKLKIRITYACKKCGSEAPIDTKMSTESWTVLDTKTPCKKCGCKQFAVKVFNE